MVVIRADMLHNSYINKAIHERITNLKGLKMTTQSQAVHAQKEAIKLLRMLWEYASVECSHAENPQQEAQYYNMCRQLNEMHLRLSDMEV